MRIWSSTCCATTRAACKEGEERGLGISPRRAQDTCPQGNTSKELSSFDTGTVSAYQSQPCRQQQLRQNQRSAVGVLPREGTYWLPTAGAAPPATAAPSGPSLSPVPRAGLPSACLAASSQPQITAQPGCSPPALSCCSAEAPAWLLPASMSFGGDNALVSWTKGNPGWD